MDPSTNTRAPPILDVFPPLRHDPGQSAPLSTTYECDTCQQTFESKIARDEHCVQNYHVRPDYECDSCASYFAHRRYRRLHVRLEEHHRQPSGQYECSTCYQVFSAGMEVRDQHCVEKSHFAPDLECCFCPMVFDSKVVLDKHKDKAWHFEFRCRYCVGEPEDRFGSDDARNVAEHEEKMHLWKCEICKTFPLIPEGCKSPFSHIRLTEEDLVLVKKHNFMEHGIRLKCDRVFEDSNKHLKEMVRTTPYLHSFL